MPISRTTNLDTVKELVRELADGFKTQKEPVNSIPKMTEVHIPQPEKRAEHEIDDAFSPNL